MAAFDLTLIEAVNLETALTYEIPFATGHTVGDVVDAAGAVVNAVTDVHGGVIIRAGSAAGNKTLVLRQGEVVCASAHGLAAGAIIYSVGNNTASDVEPAAINRITELGFAISTTRAYIDVTSYDSGGA